MHKTNINTMVHKKINAETLDNVPLCHSSFFRNLSSEQFIQIQSCRSFSKSNEKKLRLINDKRSLQKSSQFLQHKRKIKPLNLKVAYIKQEQRTKKTLCSIKGFKQKINKITHESNMNSNIKIKTQNTDISQSVERSTQKLNDQSNQSSQFHIFLNNQQLSSNQMTDPFPTLGNSLVVHDSCFNPDSLLQSNQVTQQSNHISFQNSPRTQIIHKEENNFLTPLKIKIKQQDPSTRVSFKKQKICLDNARKVETFQTLKTQNNEVCYSVAEQNQYKRFFDNIAFPDYFSGKQYRRTNNDKQARINKSIKHQANPIKLY